MSAVLAPQDAPDRQFAPGIRDDLSHADYLAIDALSSSGIKRLLQSPMHYHYDRLHPSEPTESMKLGTALHTAILEPDKFDIVIVAEDAPRRPTAVQLAMAPAKRTPAAAKSIDYWNNFDARAAGRLVLTEDQAAKVEGMVAAIRRHPIHDEYLCDGQAEQSLQWVDAHLGIPCKARFDYRRRDSIALDLKSCVDASPDGFGRAAANYRYHVQAAWYNNGHEHLFDRSLQAFLFIAVESLAPHGVSVYVPASNQMHFGADRCTEAMLLYAQARKTGYWRGYSEQVLPLQLPRWATSIATPI